jgi:hypothetical protein
MQQAMGPAIVNYELGLRDELGGQTAGAPFSRNPERLASRGRCIAAQCAFQTAFCSCEKGPSDGSRIGRSRQVQLMRRRRWYVLNYPCESSSDSNDLLPRFSSRVRRGAPGTSSLARVQSVGSLPWLGYSVEWTPVASDECRGGVRQPGESDGCRVAARERRGAHPGFPSRLNGAPAPFQNLKTVPLVFVPPYSVVP